MDNLNALDRRDPLAYPEDAGALMPPQPALRAQAGKKAHVLLVEDDQEVARAVKLRLRKSGYAVTVAYNGEAGLRAAFESEPDAIILDMRMPLMDGLTMLGEMRRETRMQRIPVIVLSAFMRDSDKRNALRLGASYFIEKPYDSLILIEAVEQAVGR